MNRPNDALQRRLLVTFRGEADEHLRALSAGLVELEQAADEVHRQQLIETAFREVHSLKGAARAVGLTDMEAVCQSAESVFAALKRRDLTITPAVLNVVREAIDTLAALLRSVQEGAAGEGSAVEESAGPEKQQVTALCRRLDRAAGGLRTSDQQSSINQQYTITEQTPPTIQPSQEKNQHQAKQSHQSQQPPTARAFFPEQQSPPPAGDVVSAPTERPRETSAATPQKFKLPDTLRLPVAKLDSALLQAETLLAAKLAAFQRAIELRNARAALTTRKNERGKIGSALKALRLGSEQPTLTSATAAAAGAAPGVGVAQPRTSSPPPVRQRQLHSLLEFIAREDALLDGLDHTLRSLEAAVERDARQLGAMVDELQDTMKQILMLPVSSMLEGFPKLVRDLCRDCDKEADLTIEGGEIAIDKRIIEELHQPLIHLLRNSVDHGIERAQERSRQGKPPRGKITLAISQQDAGRIEIKLADDGAGIDSARVRVAAAKVGLAVPEAAIPGQAMPEEGPSASDPGRSSMPSDACALVFESGVSTSPIITETSGRGLGLAIVREKVEKLGGSITAETQPRRGTQFRIVVPVRLATYRAIRVRANDEQFVLPTTLVEQVGRVDRAEIKTVENRATIPWRGEAIALTRLADVLELPRSRASGTSIPDKMPVVLVHAAARRHAFSVDEVLSEQEVLVKSFGQQLHRVRNIAGAALLGTGKVVPILNVADLMKSAIRVADRGVLGSDGPADRVTSRRKSILVAEDSITSRNLLKHILDAAGYQVRTAVDGVDAFIQLRTGDFDLVVSDVDMPRMNGFGLTQKIRADRKLADIPVVLVTALASREDRERGVDAGASAYVIKSSFDQSNLLEIVQGLL